MTEKEKFIKYGWQNIIDRCENLGNSGSERAENRYYLHKDHLGSVVGISDGSGNILSEYEYDVFGNFTLSGSDIGNSILFTGREFDKEIGLYYFRARYYSASLGRFISRDPIGQNDDVNLYAYVGNNSVMFVDPSGLSGKSALGLLFDSATWSANIFVDTISNMAKFTGFVVKLRPIQDSFLNDMSIEADEVQIHASVIWKDEFSSSFEGHTEILFFKDGKPISQLGSAPFFGWAGYYGENRVNEYMKDTTPIYKSKNVEGCINGLQNSFSNSILSGYGKITPCWNGAYSCYNGTKGSITTTLGETIGKFEKILFLPPLIK